MRKSVLVIAIALGFVASSVNASNSVAVSSNLTVVKSIVSVSPFCTSIAKGDIATVKKLISLGADVNKKSNGLTPAMYAAKYNRAEILKVLIANGAQLNKKSDKGFTAEKYAEMSNAQDALAVILHVTSKKARKV